MKGHWPTLSIVIPVRNEETNLVKLYSSLKKQTYPREKIEYLVINDGSTDRTRELSLEFEAVVIDVDRSKNTHNISYWTEFNKGLGMHKSKGEFIYWLDADMELCDEDFWQKLVGPMIENPKIVGALTREFALDCDSPVSESFLRYMSYDNTQRDPVYVYFSTDIEDTIVYDRQSYFLCKFIPGKVPASGRIMYRKSILISTDVKSERGFYDLDALEIMVESGYQLFAFVPKARLRHYHIHGFRHFIDKRVRNLEGNFFSTLNKKRFFWFRIDSNKDLLKTIYWIVYANLFIPELIKSLYKVIKYRDIAFLWQPVAAIVLTDVLVWKFITNKTGRVVVKRMLGI